MKTIKYFLIATLFVGTISLSSCLVEQRGPGYGPRPHHHHYHGGGYHHW